MNCCNCKGNFKIHPHLSEANKNFSKYEHRQESLSDKIKRFAPLVLECGHAACINCVRKERCTIRCLICDQETSKEDLVNHHYYILGHLLANTAPSTNRIHPAVHLRQKEKEEGTTQTNDENEELCQECCSLESERYCKICGTKLCSSCFQKIHSPKTMQNHGYDPLESKYSCIPLTCTTHTAKSCDNVCLTCSDAGVIKIICSTCHFAGEHTRHDCISIADWNKKHFPELVLLRENLRKKLVSLQQNKKMCEKLLQEIEPPFEKAKSDVINLFLRIHGLLQLKQRDIIMQLQENVSENAATLQHLIVKLERDYGEADKFLTTANSISEKNLDSIHFVPILDNIKNFLSSVQNLSEESLRDIKLEDWNRIQSSFDPEMFSDLVTVPVCNIRDQLDYKKDAKHQQEEPSVLAEISENEFIENLVTVKKSGVKEDESPNIALHDEPERLRLRRPFAFTDSEGAKLSDRLTDNLKAKENLIPETSKQMRKKSSALLIGTLSKVSSEAPVAIKEDADVAYNDLLHCYNKDESLDEPKKYSNYGSAIGTGSNKDESLDEQKKCSSYGSAVGTGSNVGETAVSVIHHEEDIVVTNVDDHLEIFHIQRKSDKGKIELMSEMVSRAALKAETPDFLREGCFCLAQFREDDCWYRAVVLTARSEPDPIFLVRFLDYGNEDVLTLNRIKNCPESLHPSKIAPFAYPCVLWGIKPVADDGYSREAVETFTELVSYQHQLQFFVYTRDSSASGEEFQPIFYVDIHCTYLLKSVPDDLSVSIRECFLFLEYARSTLSDEGTESKNEDEGMFWKRNYFKINVSAGSSTALQVKVSRIHSPSSFYVQLSSSQASLKIITGEMNQFYTADSVSRQLCWKIFCPKIGMVCVVKSDGDNHWMRGRVECLRPGSKVLINYVDTGEEEEVYYTRLRKISDRFLKLPAQAVHCKLINIVPNEDECWDESATQTFRDVVASESLMAIFHRKSKEVFEVSLTVNQYNKNVDVARMLMDSGLASADADKLHSRKSQAIISNFSQNEFYLGTRRSIKKLNPLRKTSEVIIAPVETVNKPGAALSAGLLSICHLIEVVEVFSPAFIHTKRFSEMQKFREYQDELYSHMASANYVTDGNFKASVGKVCVANFGKIPFFARVKLLEKSGELFKALLLDCGGIQDVHEKKLIALPKALNVGKPFCTLVSLANLIPPCGEKKWPTSTVDCLKSSLKENGDIYMIIKGHSYRNCEMWNLKILPVELGWMREISGGPFEKDDSTFVSVKDVLLYDGLALPCRNPDQAAYRCDTSSSEAAISVDGSSHLLGSPDDVNPVDSITTKEEADPEAEMKVSIKALPPQPPLDLTFKAHVTNVDMEGNVCLHTFEAKQSLSMMLRAHCFLCEEKKCSDADLCWEVGDYVLAKYHLDEHWYRAQILQWDKHSTEIKVEFIDYGNIETVNLQDIRIRMPYAHVPVQCYKCTLGIIPVAGNWSVKTLDFLHQMIVTKDFEVTVLDQKKRCVPRIEMIYLDNDRMDVADFFVNKLKICKYLRCLEEVCEYEEEEDAEHSLDVIIESDDSDDELFEVASLQYPTDPTELIVVHVVSIIDPVTLYITPKGDLVDPVCVGEFWKHATKAINSIRELQNYLTSNASTYKLQRQPQVGGMYVVKEDLFYRAKILNVTDRNAHVQYVDYGHVEEVDTDSFYLIPAEFKRIPSLAIQVQLRGIGSPGGRPWGEEAMNGMIKCLMNIEQKIFASFNGSEETPRVDLFFKDRDGKKTLCYKRLLDEGLLSLE